MFGRTRCFTRDTIILRHPKTNKNVAEFCDSVSEEALAGYVDSQDVNAERFSRCCGPRFVDAGHRSLFAVVTVTTVVVTLVEVTVTDTTK